MPAKKAKTNNLAYKIKCVGDLFCYRVVNTKLVKKVLLILFFIIFTPVVIFMILKPKVRHELNYGVTFSNKYAQQLGLDWKEAYITILDDLELKNIRLVAYWDEIESERDVYNYENILWQLDEAEQRNINVIMTVGRKVPRYPECFEPGWWKELEDEEEKKAELIEYVSDALITFKPYGNIKKWQIENEPFFPFGICEEIKKETVVEEIRIARLIDNRPILVQDSGEGGFWKPSYKLGDYLGISMYRKIWYDFWKVLFGRFVYFKYPLAHWTYKIKADLVGVPIEKIIVTELQAEPWGPGSNHELTNEEKNKTMSRTDFLATLSYATRTGMQDFYLWGVEWWLWERDRNNNSFYWDTAKALFK